MTDAAARVMFALTVVLLVPTLAYLYWSSQPSSGGDNVVVTQFEDAFPLVEGMNVRVDGAIVGSIARISVEKAGFAEVALRLDENVKPARADATAAIRQQDTTGDSYVAYSPGKSTKPLPEIDGVPTIACDPAAREDRCPDTLVAPRFDDLLNAFGPAERSGLQLILTELARAVDERGGDINRAALDLRPGLAAANRAVAEVDSQNAALRRFITDAEAVTGQAADRSRSLGKAIEGLASTLDVTAAEAGSLDAAIKRLPATAEEAEATLAELRRTANAAEPLARTLGAGAPDLATALRRAPAFTDHLESFLKRTRPTLDLTRDLVRAAGPTIAAEPSRVVTGPFDLAPAISNLLRGVLGEDETIEVLFNEKFGLGAVAQEPGNQPSYPAEHKDRRMLRVSAILNCDAFGVEVKPGCLLDLVTAARARAARQDGGGDRRRRERPRRRRPEAPSIPVEAPAAPQVPAATPTPRPRRPLLPQLDLTQVPVPKPGQPVDKTVEDLLDFLLK